MKDKIKDNNGNHPQDCNFGLTKFNLKKRDVRLSVEEAALRNRPTGGTSGGSTANTVTISLSSFPLNTGTTNGAGAYRVGRNVTVSAAAASGYVFDKWTEGAATVSTSIMYKFSASVNRTLVANFKPGGATSLPSVILLDFTGYTVSGTSWNWNGDIICAPANLAPTEVDVILAAVQKDFEAYNVIVTTDEALYNSANPSKRMRVIITETWEWFGQAGGVAYVNSFTWGNNTPCFVFSSLLNYNSKYISDAASHEVGHTIGLYHQSTYGADCVKTAEYNRGCCGSAPTMGVSYYEILGLWWIGPNSNGCNSIQDDNQILISVLGLK